MGTVKYTGPVASFHCPTNAEIRSLKVHFSPKQEGTGDPSPENVRPIVGWDGVQVQQNQSNLFNENSMTYSRWTDGSGNVNKSATYGCISEKIRTNSTSFTLIAMAERPNSMSIIEYNANGDFLRRTHGNQVQYVKVNATWSSTAYIAVQISDSNGGTTITPEYVSQRNMMLVEGTDDPIAYEPYHGSTTNYEFGVLGKNKFPASDGKTSDIFLATNTTYTFSATSPSAGYFKGWYEDETDTGLIWINAGADGNRRWKTYTPEKNIIKGLFYVGTGMSECQIELGSSATTYEPYDPNKTVYGGWVDLVSGEVCEEYIAKDMGQINWNKSSSGNKFYIIGLSPSYSWQSDLTMYCSIYKFDGANVGNVWYGDNYTIRYYYTSSGNSREIYIHDERYDNAQDFKTAMEGINLVYKLNTPNTYHLAPTSMQTFLSHNNIWSNADYVEVEYDLHEAQNILARKQFIIANQPHVEKLAVAPLQNFVTDMVAPLKECKVYFSPIQEGSGDPSPENVRAISGWTGLDVHRTGKNFAEKMLGYNSIGSNNTNTSITTDTTGNVVSSLISVKAGLKYLMSFSGKTSSPRFFWFDRYPIGTGATSISGQYALRNVTATAPDNAKYLFIVWTRGELTATVGNVQVEEVEAATTPTDYEPYIGTTIPITFPSEAGTVYGGYVDLVTGEVVAEKSVLTIGAETPLQSCAMSHNVLRPVYTLPYTGTNANAISSNIFGLRARNTAAWNYPIKGMLSLDPHNDLATRVAIGAPEGVTTQEEWITWLEEYGPVQVLYQLATPAIVAALTPTQLKTLRGTNNIWSNANGNIEIAYWKH